MAGLRKYQHRSTAESIASPLASPSPYHRNHSHWVPDEHALACMLCNQSFTLLTRRRHHCRRCGSVVCNDCSLHRLKIPPHKQSINDTDAAPMPTHTDSDSSSSSEIVRVCDACYAKHQLTKQKRQMKLSSNSTSNSAVNTPMSTQSVRSIFAIRDSGAGGDGLMIAGKTLTFSDSDAISSDAPTPRIADRYLASHSSMSRSSSANQSLTSLSQSLSQPVSLSVQPAPSPVLPPLPPSRSPSPMPSTLSVSASVATKTEKTPSRAPSPLPDSTPVLLTSASQTQPLPLSTPVIAAPSPLISTLTDYHTRSESVSFVDSGVKSPPNETVYHCNEIPAPHWCDALLTATGIALPTTAASTSIEESEQTEMIVSLINFTTIVSPVIEFLSESLTVRPAFTLLALVPLFYLVNVVVIEQWSAVIVLAQLVTLHYVTWLSFTDVEADAGTHTDSESDSVVSAFHRFLHVTDAPFRSSRHPESMVVRVTWLLLGLVLSFGSYRVGVPLYWLLLALRPLVTGSSHRSKGD